MMYVVNSSLSIEKSDENEIICTLIRSNRRHSFIITSDVEDIINFCREPRTESEIAEYFAQKTAFDKLNFFDFFQKFLLDRHFLTNRELTNGEIKLRSREQSVMTFRIKLLSSALINAITPMLAFLFNPIVAMCAVTSYLVSLVFMLSFITADNINLMDLSIYNSIAVIALISVGLLFHELGHATAASKYGCRKVEIGVGWYIYFIVFYAELSEAWKLSPKKRLVIDCAGGYFQAIYSVAMLVAFVITDEMFFLSACVLLNLYNLFNLNPFFRLDGYWIASDILRTKNLRANAFAVIKRIFISPRVFVSEVLAGRQKEKTSLLVYSVLMLLFYCWFSYFVAFNLFPHALSVVYSYFEKNIEGFEFVYFSVQFCWNLLIIYFVLYYFFSMVRVCLRTLSKRYIALK